MRVRIRHELDLRGCDFCEIEPTQQAIDRLIAMLRQAGGVYYNDDETNGKIKNISYGFCLDEDGAYCELSLSGEAE